MVPAGNALSSRTVPSQVIFIHVYKLTPSLRRRLHAQRELPPNKSIAKHLLSPVLAHLFVFHLPLLCTVSQTEVQYVPCGICYKETSYCHDGM